MDTLYHYTSCHHMMEIISSGKLKLTPSNLLRPNLRIENHCAVSDTDNHKPVVWLTSREDPEKIGVFFPSNLMPPDYDKRRIQFTIPNDPALGIKPWGPWATQNHMNKAWRRTLAKGMDHESWYISEREIPLSAVTHIRDLFETVEYTGWK